MTEVTFFSALFGGMLTFSAPCTLPLIPGYIAFIGGSSGSSGETRHATIRSDTLRNALFFVLGFSLIFILFGMASGAVGKFLVLYRTLIAQVGGVIIIYFGLSMLGFLPFPSFSAVSSGGRLSGLFGGRISGTRSGSFFLGLLFALGWSPCLGPILGTILLLAATGGTALYGGSLLAVYALGLATPFLIVAFLYGSTFAYVAKLEPYLYFTRLAGGVMLMFVGILLVIGQFGILNTWAGGLFDGRLIELMLTHT